MHSLEILNIYCLLHASKLVQSFSCVWPDRSGLVCAACPVSLGLRVTAVLLLCAGVLYLQYGDETKQLRMPNEITSADTIRALFVSAFPQQLTMKMLESPSVAIYIKDESRNVYYELNDVR